MVTHGMARKEFWDYEAEICEAPKKEQGNERLKKVTRHQDLVNISHNNILIDLFLSIFS